MALPSLFLATLSRVWWIGSRGRAITSPNPAEGLKKGNKSAVVVVIHKKKIL